MWAIVHVMRKIIKQNNSKKKHQKIDKSIKNEF